MFKKILKFKVSIGILIFLLIAVGIFTYLSFYRDISEKWSSLYGGIAAGFAVAVIQFLMDWESFNAIDKQRNLQLKEVLLTRNDKQYYGNLLKDCRKMVDVMGVSGERFMKDFSDTDRNATQEERVIIELINSHNVKVRILMPRLSYLSNENQTKLKEAIQKFEEMNRRFPNNFNVRYFDHTPAHSIVRVDSECIIGPVFPNVSSRYTPALHFYIGSPLVEKYTEYFEDEWNNGFTNYA